MVLVYEDGAGNTADNSTVFCASAISKGMQAVGWLVGV